MTNKIDKIQMPDGQVLELSDGLEVCDTDIVIRNNEKTFNQLKQMRRSTFDLSKFTVVGSPTITDDGIASGFSSSNYITAPLSIIPTSNIVIKTKSIYSTIGNTSEYPQSKCIWMLDWDSFRINSSNGKTIDIVSTVFGTDRLDVGTLKDGDIIETEVVLTTSKLVLNVTVNGQFYTFSKNVTTTFGEIGTLYIGKTRTGNYYWTGSIDLKQFSITVDGKEVFSGNKTGIDTIKADNYEVVGSPVISEDGIASGFDTSNYITIPYLANFATKNVFDFTFEYKTSTLNQLIIASSNGVFRVEIGNSYFQIKYSNTHTFYVDYHKTVSDGDIVRIRLTINDNNMNHCTVWINNIIANEIKNNTTDFSSFSFSNLRIGVGNNDAYKFIGSIDLNAFKIYVDGNLVYQPCLKIPYTQSKTGSKIVDVAYRDRVIDLYEQEGKAKYYTIDELNKNFTLPMGEIYGMIENIKNTKSGGSGLEICDIGMALYVDETKGLRRYLNGQIVDINTNTQAFLNRLLEIKNTNPDYSTTEENWQSEALLNIDGCVYKFVLNYSGETVVSVRLPKYPDYVEINAGGTLPVVGNGMTLGLTDGTNVGSLRYRADYGEIGVGSQGYGIPIGTNISSYSAGIFIGTGIGITTDPTKSGIQTTLKQTKLKMRYFIQVATGSETENNIINEIELNNPYSLFDSKYSDHELNNLSWLKSEGQWNAKAVYPSAYDELLREYNNPDRLATFNKDAFTVVGSPTITEDGVASGFSSGNYVKVTTFNSTGKNNFIIEGIFSTGTDIQTGQCIFYTTKYSGFLIANGRPYIGISSDGTSQNIFKAQNINYQLKTNTKYYYRFIFTGTAYILEIGEDITNLTSINIVNSTEMMVIDNLLIFGIGGTLVEASDNILLGSIDLKKFSITADGVKVLSGAKSKVKLSTEEYTDYDFVLNTAEETFRLPLKTKLASGKAVVGDGMTLGLTNNSENFGVDKYLTNSSLLGNPHAYGVPTGSSVTDAGMNSKTTIGVTTDPTKSGIELSDSGLYLYFYVGETVQNANLIDAGRIGEQLANKQDKCIHIIDTYVNGTSGYNIWSNGYCEQWGIATHTINEFTVTCIKNFKDTNFLVFLSYPQHYSYLRGATSSYNITSVNTFTVCGGYGTNQGVGINPNLPVTWIAKGYLASGQY